MDSKHQLLAVLLLALVSSHLQAQERSPAPLQLAVAPRVLPASKPAAQAGVLRRLAPGAEFRDCTDCPEMVLVPPGDLATGLPDSEAAPSDRDGSAPAAAKSNVFALGKYEVTQREWEAVMGNNPSKFGDCGDNCPVERVSWDDIQIFLEKLNARTGKQYRLPTEEEWEYACHGGSQTKYCGGNDIEAVGWHAGNSSGRTHPAGQKQANGYGLYDMTGNAWEWVSDCWSKNCAHRVFRGGAWSIPGNMLDTDRYGNKPAMRGEEIGFRIARTLP